MVKRSSGKKVTNREERISPSTNELMQRDEEYSDSSMASFIDDSEAPPILPQSLTAPRIKRDINTLNIPTTSNSHGGKKKSKRMLAVEQKSDDYFKMLMANFDSDASSSDKEDELAVTINPQVIVSIPPLKPSPLEVQHIPKVDDHDMDIDDALLTSELFMENPSSMPAKLDTSVQDLSNQWDITEEDLLACNFFEGPMQQVSVDVEQIPREQSKINLNAEEGAVSIWWFDAHERYDGLIVLFGKTWDESSSSYVSCSVQVHNSLRNVFVLPRESIQDTEKEVTFEDVRKELAELAGRYGVPRFGCRMVSRKYAFEIPDIPVEADYLKMVYEFTCTNEYF